MHMLPLDISCGHANYVYLMLYQKSSLHLLWLLSVSVSEVNRSFTRSIRILATLQNILASKYLASVEP